MLSEYEEELQLLPFERILNSINDIPKRWLVSERGKARGSRKNSLRDGGSGTAEPYEMRDEVPKARTVTELSVEEEKKEGTTGDEIRATSVSDGGTTEVV